MSNLSAAQNDAITWHTKTGGFAEASDLGLPPGSWPLTREFRCRDGVDRSFALTGKKRNSDGEIEEVTYRNLSHGYSICVLND